MMKIAFGGNMGVGKDTAVEYLQLKYPQAIVTSFAEPIYEILKFSQNICNFTPEKDRKFLQFIGTDWARNKDPNVWVNLVLEKTKTKNCCLLSDIRFLNELVALKENNWICIRITRNDTEKNRCGTGDKKHISEKELNSIPEELWDYSIQNDHNLDSFYKKIDNIVEKINK